MVNHTNTATLGLGDAFESPLADPMVHVTAYLDDAFSLELVYVPFLAPDLVGIDELDFDLTLGTYDIDARFENPRLPLFSEWAHSVHAALSYTSFVVDAQVTYSFFRDQTPDFDLSGIQETSRTVDGETHYVIRGAVVPGYYRAHNFGVGASAALGGWVLSADGGLKLTENADGTRIDIKRPEILYAVQADRAVSIGRQPFNVSAGLYHRLILHADAELKSEYSPLDRERRRRAPRLLPAAGGAVDRLRGGPAGHQPVPGNAERRGDRRLGDHRSGRSIWRHAPSCG